MVENLSDVISKALFEILCDAQDNNIRKSFQEIKGSLKDAEFKEVVAEKLGEFIKKKSIPKKRRAVPSIIQEFSSEFEDNLRLRNEGDFSDDECTTTTYNESSRESRVESEFLDGFFPKRKKQPIDFCQIAEEITSIPKAVDEFSLESNGSINDRRHDIPNVESEFSQESINSENSNYNLTDISTSVKTRLKPIQEEFSSQEELW